MWSCNIQVRPPSQEDGQNISTSIDKPQMMEGDFMQAITYRRKALNRRIYDSN